MVRGRVKKREWGWERDTKRHKEMNGRRSEREGREKEGKRGEG